MKNKAKKETIENIRCVIQSCQEAIDGDWDCSTDEGRKGFGSMIDLLELAIEAIEAK